MTWDDADLGASGLVIGNLVHDFAKVNVTFRVQISQSGHYFLSPEAALLRQQRLHKCVS